MFCSVDQLIPQLQKMVKICLSHYMILYQSEIFVVIFGENFVFHIQVSGINFGPQKLSKSYLRCATWLVQVSFAKETVVLSAMVERDRLLVAERSDLVLWMKVEAWFWSCNSFLIYESFLGIVIWHFQVWHLFLSWYVCNSILFFKFICSENDLTITWQL